MVQIWTMVQYGQQLVLGKYEALSARNNKKHSNRTKKTNSVDSMITVSFEEELSLFFKNVK